MWMKRDLWARTWNRAFIRKQGEARQGALFSGAETFPQRQKWLPGGVHGGFPRASLSFLFVVCGAPAQQVCTLQRRVSAMVTRRSALGVAHLFYVEGETVGCSIGVDWHGNRWCTRGVELSNLFCLEPQFKEGLVKFSLDVLVGIVDSSSCIGGSSCTEGRTAWCSICGCSSAGACGWCWAFRRCRCWLVCTNVRYPAHLRVSNLLEYERQLRWWYREERCRFLFEVLVKLFHLPCHDIHGTVEGP